MKKGNKIASSFHHAKGEMKLLPMTGMEKVGGLWGKLIERRANKYKHHINGQLPKNTNLLQ